MIDVSATVSVTPDRAVVWHAPAPNPSDMTEELRKAYLHGTGAFLWELGLTHVSATLSASLGFFRDFGKMFVSRLCLLPDLTQTRGGVVPEPPTDYFATMAEVAPPMAGLEYVNAEALAQWWEQIAKAAEEALQHTEETPQQYLRKKHASWSAVGRICLHLAENKNDSEHPFAFLATYVKRAGQKNDVVHVQLSKALTHASQTGDKTELLSLLVPMERAAQNSPFVKNLLETGQLYRPSAWLPEQAFSFLQDIPLLEAAGVMVRIPNWWSQRQKAKVGVTVGRDNKSQFGQEALLSFEVNAAIGDEVLTEAEVKTLLASRQGLVFLRGKWVEIDSEKLQQALGHWQDVARHHKDGISLLEAMRLLAGASIDGLELEFEAWSEVRSGDWLAQTLQELRQPGNDQHCLPGPQFAAKLRPYQQVGADWLWFASRLGLGICLADDMGLGKTVQVLALLSARKKVQGSEPQPHLLVVPASLLGNWAREIAKFAPDVSYTFCHSSAGKKGTSPAELCGYDLVISTYGHVMRNTVIRERSWDLVILDEAQAIKNSASKQTRAIKSLRAKGKIALTGTPVENNLGDLWSLFDFLNPGLLGNATQFAKWNRSAAKAGPSGYASLRRLVAPYILRRLKSDKTIISDLPDKTEIKTYCTLSKLQAALYQETVTELARALQRADGMQRRGLVLATLMRLKQICNHPAHWLKHSEWSSNESGKFQRLRELAEVIAAKQEHVLVFSQFQEICGPLSDFLSEIFGSPGAVLTGQTKVAERGKLVDAFQRGDYPFMVLSVKAGGTGLTLTKASHVVHFDRWWNPAVENQATDRAYRIGQNRAVMVHKFICQGTMEERVDALIESKKDLAESVVGEPGAALLTEMSNDDLLQTLSLDLTQALATS